MRRKYKIGDVIEAIFQQGGVEELRKPMEIKAIRKTEIKDGYGQHIIEFSYGTEVSPICWFRQEDIARAKRGGGR